MHRINKQNLVKSKNLQLEQPAETAENLDVKREHIPRTSFTLKRKYNFKNI